MCKCIKKCFNLFSALLLPFAASPLMADQVVIHNIPDAYSFGVDAFNQEYLKVSESATLGYSIITA